MSWEIGYDNKWARDIGYGVPCVCDHPLCAERIDRGLAHVCGGEPYGGELGCGLYFCSRHLHGSPQRCDRCDESEEGPFDPKGDVPEWIEHKATDPSWAKWRASALQTASEHKENR